MCIMPVGLPEYIFWNNNEISTKVEGRVARKNSAFEIVVTRGPI